MANESPAVHGRRSGLPLGIAALLHSLVEPTQGQTLLADVPADFALPSESAGVIHTAVEFSGTVAATKVPAELRALTRSRRRDLLGLAWTIRALAAEGRAAVIVPEALLAETTQGHLQLRRLLIEQGRLHGVIRLAPGCYKARSAAAILLLGPSETDGVWFCDIADAGALQSDPGALAPECILRWRERAGSEKARLRSDSSHVVPRAEITAAQFDLSPTRYRTEHAAATVPARPPQEILAELAGLEAEIFQSLRELVGMLKP